MYYRNSSVEILHTNTTKWFRVAIPFTYSVIKIDRNRNYTIDDMLKMSLTIKDGDRGLPEYSNWDISWDFDLYWLRVNGWYKDLKSYYTCSRWQIYKEKLGAKRVIT